MESTESRVCSICRQLRPVRDFPKEGGDGRLLAKANICLWCRLATGQADEEGGGGGQQLKLKKDSKQLQYAMELDAALKKKLESLEGIVHNKDIFGVSQAVENERKKQAGQREELELKEKALKNVENNNEPNQDLAKDTQVKREKVTRLFSITRLLARNHLAANIAKATLQKKFGVFSPTKEQQVTQKIERINKTNTNKALSTESSTLFSQQHGDKSHVADEAEQLKAAIQKGQKIFTR